MKLLKLFKRRYKYSPIAYIGRKKVARILGADIIKLKKLEKMDAKDTKHSL